MMVTPLLQFLSVLGVLVALALNLDGLLLPYYPVPAHGSAVLVTGAKRGIGYSAAVALAKSGFFVFLSTHSRSDADALNARAMPNIRAIELDMTNPGQIQSVERTVREWCVAENRSFAGVVLNGFTVNYGFVESLRIEDLEASWKSGVRGSVALTQALIPLLRRYKGRVVGITSMAQFIPGVAGSSYSSAKAALGMFLACLRSELFPSQVAVSIIAPGFIATEAFLSGNETMRQVFEAIKTSNPYFYARKDNVMTTFNYMASRAWSTTASGSTDDCILHAFTSAQPKLSYFPGYYGVSANKVIRLVNMLPESVLFWFSRAI